MKKKFFLALPLILLVLALLPLGSVLAQDEEPVVHAVLFYSSTCPHCAQVINFDLPPLFEKYGEQLDIVSFETSDLATQKLFDSTIKYYVENYGYSADQFGGVPMLIVGEHVLIGSYDIPEQLPGIIEEGLANGGIPFPEIPGLDAALEEAASTAAEKHAEESDLPAQLTMGERFALDPAGNTVSVIVLLGMLLVVGMVAVNFRRTVANPKEFPNWLLPSLAAIGLVAAIYLSYIEVTQTEAICGPVGDCNTVQQSRYATLFGFLPVGVLGVVGYLLIFAAWGIQNYGKAAWRQNAVKALWLMAGFGTLFSIYLTFLEPFAIGATCMWCITSAIMQTAIFWLTTEPAKAAFNPARKSKRKRHHPPKKSASRKRRKR